MASILKSLRILSDPVRLRLLLLLSEEELTVAELQEIVGLGQSRISSGLSQLKSEALVEDRRVGKNIFYRAADDLGEATRAVLAEAQSELKEPTADKAHATADTNATLATHSTPDTGGDHRGHHVRKANLGGAGATEVADARRG